MSSEHLEQFFKLLAANPEQQAKVKEIGGDVDALSAFARESGYDISPEEVREYQDNAREFFKARAQEKLARTISLQSPGAQAFYELMKLGENDKSVAERLGELGAGEPGELIAYGKEKGFEFSEQDIKAAGEYILEPSNELSEEELELAAGGTTVLLFVGILAFGAFALGTAGVAVAVAFAVSKK